MNVIYGKEAAKQFGDKYILLELDTFMVNDEPLTAYCVIGADSIPLGKIQELDHWRMFHDKLINGYKTKQWSFCKDCIFNLRGHWGGEIDSFYDDLEKRVVAFMEEEPEDFDPIIYK